VCEAKGRRVRERGRTENWRRIENVLVVEVSMYSEGDFFLTLQAKSPSPFFFFRVPFDRILSEDEDRDNATAETTVTATTAKAATAAESTAKRRW